MTRCPSCSARVASDAKFCASCGTALEATPDATLPRSTPSSVRTPPPSSGSPAPGRFLPGTLLAGRYRVVGLLGRGGMGEVYRADDLKLGQPVALKFLPEAVQHDPARLERLLAEVRLARAVSHSRVCRVYDIGETEGQHYLSMEYVDGEDLASLLRQIGRLPREKAVDIGRQICAGLAAAHEQGILHRDLKPANVMIDGRGRVRLTDFGLASLAELAGADAGVGTPAYMAPEQLAGRDASIPSDIYALGLVLYELFTGKRAFARDNPAERLRLRGTSTPTSPSRLVEGLDPSVERAILRCLDPDPARRPPSALAVAAALPGGNPLAEALAAGELPSPEMVAEAGAEGSLRPALAWSLLAIVLVGTAVVISQAEKTQLARIVPLEKSPDVLVARAREVLARAGYAETPRDEVFRLSFDHDYLAYVEQHESPSDAHERLRRGVPSAARFVYRQSPHALAPYNWMRVFPIDFDPPLLTPGEKRLSLDSEGRLMSFEAVPPEYEDSSDVVVEPDWSTLFEDARLDTAQLTRVAPRWTWPIHSDRRFAWEGPYPDAEDLGIRVEAASARSRPVLFRIVPPWVQPRDVERTSRRSSRSWLAEASTVVFLVGALSTLVAALLIARANLRRGRGDRQGALKLALGLLAGETVVWLLGSHHVAFPQEIFLLGGGLAAALLSAALVWVLYIALEPVARRHWPMSLTSWVRLLDGKMRDPLVGRDCLIGCVLGLLFALSDVLFQIAPSWWGSSAVPEADREVAGTLAGTREALSVAAQTPIGALQNTFLFMVFLALLRVLLRRTWLAITVFFVVGVVTQSDWSGNMVLDLAYGVIQVAAFLFVFFRFGLLSVLVGMWFVLTLESFPLTFDFSVWYGGRTLLAVVMLVTTALYAFRVSLGGRPAMKVTLLE